MVCRSIIPQNTNGKKISESSNSPPIDERMALSPKYLPLLRTFILLIIQALQVEPQMNAKRDAMVVLGTIANSELKCSATCLLDSSAGAGRQQTICDITATNALSANASQITSRDFL